MSSTSYVVPHVGFRAAANLRVHGIDPEVFSLLLDSESTTAPGQPLGSRLLPVTLGRSTPGAGLVVYRDSRKIGVVAAAAAAEYPELTWILEAGLSPEVTARLSIDSEGYPGCEILLPPPGLCVPANDPPDVRWAMVEGTTATEVHSIPTALPSYPTKPLHFLVVLRARNVLGYRSVSAYVDGTFIGTLGREDARRLAGTVAEYNRSGMLAVARGFYQYNNGAPSLTLYADPDSVPRKLYTIAAGTAAATGMVLAAAAAGRAEAEIATTGFFTSAGTAATGTANVISAASAGAAGVSGAAGAKSVGAGATGTTSATGATGSAGAASAAGGLGAAGASSAAGVGLSLPALAAASTAIIAAGGLGITANTLYPDESRELHTATPATSAMAPDGESPTPGEYAAQATDTSQEDPTRSAGNPAIGTQLLADSTNSDTDPAPTSARSNRAEGPGSTSANKVAGPTVSRSTSTAPTQRPDTNAGISVVDLRPAATGDYIVAGEAPTRSTTTRPTTAQPSTTAALPDLEASEVPVASMLPPAEETSTSVTNSVSQLEPTSIPNTEPSASTPAPASQDRPSALDAPTPTASVPATAPQVEPSELKITEVTTVPAYTEVTVTLAPSTAPQVEPTELVVPETTDPAESTEPTAPAPSTPETTTPATSTAATPTSTQRVTPYFPLTSAQTAASSTPASSTPATSTRASSAQSSTTPSSSTPEPSPRPTTTVPGDTRSADPKPTEDLCRSGWFSSFLCKLFGIESAIVPVDPPAGLYTELPHSTALSSVAPSSVEPSSVAPSSGAPATEEELITTNTPTVTEPSPTEPTELGAATETTEPAEDRKPAEDPVGEDAVAHRED